VNEWQQDKKESMFFFEKKNQKTFKSRERADPKSATANKSFLVLFCKKEHSSLL
jgi:hypothetical protein